MMTTNSLVPEALFVLIHSESVRFTSDSKELQIARISIDQIRLTLDRCYRLLDLLEHLSINRIFSWQSHFQLCILEKSSRVVRLFCIIDEHISCFVYKLKIAI